MAKKLLITGGTGTLGSHLVRQAIASGAWDEVHATNNSQRPNFHKVFWYPMDARQPVQDIVERIAPTHILHTLALSSPDICEKNKLEAWQVNVSVTQSLAEYAAQNKARLIYTSTDLIFDGTKGDYAESDEPQPLNFYADSKLEGENAVRDVMKDGHFVIVRLANLYGPNLNGKENFFMQMMKDLREGSELKLFTDQMRSVMSVSNAAACLLELMDLSFEGVLHLGGTQAVSRYEFGQMLARAMQIKKPKIRKITMAEMPGGAKRPANVSLKIKQAQTILSTKLLTPEEGLKREIEGF